MRTSRSGSFAAVAAVALAGSALGQVELYAVDFPGNLYRVNQSTGATTLVGATGFTRLNSAAADAGGAIFASRFRDLTNPADTNKLIRIDRTTGLGTLVADYGTANDLRALAFVPGGRLFGIREGTIDELVSIDPGTGVVTLVGPTGLSDLQGLTSNDAGELFAVGVLTVRLSRLDPMTGLATTIASVTGGISGGELQTVEWFGGNRSWTGRSALWTLDLATGVAAMVGPFGVSDVRGLAAVTARCYADCDQNNTLNVNDFICFQSAFAASLPYADCNHDNALNVNDFVCFQAAFAAGCP